MSAPPSNRVWDEASTPAAARIARQFETRWQAARPSERPDPIDFLTDEAPSGALLALLRAELALRWEAGERVGAESYRDRFPDLDADTFVALIYEEFCLREESNLGPEPAEYYERFPELAERLRRVLGIHDLVGTGKTTTFSMSGASVVPFPEAGQTIAGFHLVEELGRGSFARVFKAEERQLADRPVALKVARTGSPEPQTLARLQHTHIVPVHSYRIDPATGLHLLCMPYLGEVTLAKLLADPQVSDARSGSELLDALDRLAPSGRMVASATSAGRAALAGRSFVRAIAWWGARLSEALQHAHERGVLHRDIKPSNVLVAADGSPMLLDFNLAGVSCLDDLETSPTNLGGTLAYMAPEHLEALAVGQPGALDERADIYSLGVVLYEAMGTPPFSPPRNARSIQDILLRSAEQRRAGATPLRELHPEVPPEFAAVVHRCLAADRADRYASAAELAADLRAVTDDRPLRHAREPLPNRSVRFVRRHRMRLAIALPVLIAVGVATVATEKTRLERERVMGEVRQLIDGGMVLAGQERLDLAAVQFDLATKFASDQPPVAKPPSTDKVRTTVRMAGQLNELRAIAQEQARLTADKQRTRAMAAELAQRAESLRLQLLGFLRPVQSDPSLEVRSALDPFYVMVHPSWPPKSELDQLDAPSRQRLLADVEDLLFLWAVALDRQLDVLDGEAWAASRATALACCDRALGFTGNPGPWGSLRHRLGARTDPKTRPVAEPTHQDPLGERSDRACFEWAVLLVREGRTRLAIAWLEQAIRIRQDEFWYHYFLGLQYQNLIEEQRRRPDEGPDPLLTHYHEQALARYNVAIALRPERPWPRFNRSRLYQQMGLLSQALDDLRSALERAEPHDQPPILLNLGHLEQSLGHAPAARAAYSEVLASVDANDPLARAARLNRAGLDVEAGEPERALAEYDSLLATDDADTTARLARALIALRTGRPRSAQEDLDRLIERGPPQAVWYAYRAEARLAGGHPLDADSDAAMAQRLAPSLAFDRLRLRTRFALGQVRDLTLGDPDEIERLPVGGPALTADLRIAAELLARQPDDVSALVNRAVILSALGDDREALATADLAARLAPQSGRCLRVRARVRLRAGDLSGAIEDAQRGLRIDPEDARCLALRGRLLTMEGHPETGLIDLNRAELLGADWSLHKQRARTLMELNRNQDAVEAWTTAARIDPEDPLVFVGRAQCFVKLGLWEQALADLEKAAGWSGNRVDVLAQIGAIYAECLPARPDRLPRLLHFARRGIAASRIRVLELDRRP